MLEIVVILLVINFAISWFNAYSVGRSWADSKVIGGWLRFMVWCGAVMSASGFTWCYLVGFALIGTSTDLLPMKYIQVALELGYVVVILPTLGSGIAIWMDSVTTAWRRRDTASAAVAAWNTYAMAHDTCEAATILPRVFKDLYRSFSVADEDDKEGLPFLLATLTVFLVLSLGVITTAAIVRSTARKYARAVRLSMASKSPTRAA